MRRPCHLPFAPDLTLSHLPGRHTQKSHGVGAKLRAAAFAAGGKASEAVDVLDGVFSDVAPISSTMEHARTAMLASGLGVVPEKAIKTVYVAGNLSEIMSGTPVGTAVVSAVGGAVAGLGALNIVKNKITLMKAKKEKQLKAAKEKKKAQRQEKRKSKAARKVGRGVTNIAMNKDDTTTQQRDNLTNRMLELWEQAKEFKNPERWLTYYSVAKLEGSDDDEAEAIADLLMEEEESDTANEDLTLHHQPGKHSQKSHGRTTTTRRGETLVGVVREGKTWKMEDGSDLPEHVSKLAIPPAWKDVVVNLDPKGTLMAKGVDAKGRTQSRYSDSHSAKQAAAKFGRTSELREKRNSILAEVNEDAKSPQLKDRAECLKLVMQTGMRPGSDKDTKADFQSYGATTLLGKHVIPNQDGTVTIRAVTGKSKGKEVEFHIKDKRTASMLKRRAKSDEQPLFKTNASELRTYSKQKNGGGFKTKDFRTALGTETAIKQIKSMPKPKTKKAYQQQVKAVATEVSRTLGNTPTVALKSYIDPTVFSGWRID